MPASAYPIAVAALFGATVGSFLNVTIVRLPVEQSVIRPRSRCPTCRTPIAWYDNIPILSWILLRARCRHCGGSISVQYPLVEAATAVLWALAAWHYGPTLDALAAAVFGTILLGIAMTDARHYLIPDEYTWGGLIPGLLFAVRNGPVGITAAVIGAAVGFGLLYVVAWAGEKALRKEAMGGGDIKMMAMVGSFVGWKGVLLTVFLGALLGTLIHVPLTLKKPRRLVPFGVFLAAAAAITYVWGDQLIAWYLGFIGVQ